MLPLLSFVYLIIKPFMPWLFQHIRLQVLNLNRKDFTPIQFAPLGVFILNVYLGLSDCEQGHLFASM